MLNELLTMQRGLEAAGVEMVQRHPDVGPVRSMPMLHVLLDDLGAVMAVRPLAEDVKPWTLRDGNHNSFPFVQLKPPLLRVRTSRRLHDIAAQPRHPRRREAMLRLLRQDRLDEAEYNAWPGAGLLRRVAERREAVASLRGGPAEGVLDAMDRFILAFESPDGAADLMRGVLRHLAEGLGASTVDAWQHAAAAILMGKLDGKKGAWCGAGALLFDAAGGSGLPIHHPRVAGLVSGALRKAESASTEVAAGGWCGLTGQAARLIESKFPQPNLPTLGQTYLFARNSQTPSTWRYGRGAMDTMPVGQATAVRLDAAATTLTADARRGITWRPLPGERPGQSDLLIAFIEAAPEAEVAALLADDYDESMYEESEGDKEADELHEAESVAAFTEQAGRVIRAVQANDADLAAVRVRFVIFRQLDPGNRKAIYGGEKSARELADAAEAWRDGERNVPVWLTMPTFRKGEKVPRAARPPHVAPLGLIGFSRGLFTRGGTRRQEAQGLPASEAFSLFIGSDGDRRGRRQAERVLALVLARRTALVTGAAHALRKGLHHARDYDCREALRAATVLGVLLLKLDRTKELYMNEAAFKLGQLLAAADQVHAGYCAGKRNGDVPPSLLGNQVFAMAQTAPAKALAVLCGRWKPYKGWVDEARRDFVGKEDDPEGRRRADVVMRADKRKDVKQKGWDIAVAISMSRRIEALMAELRHLPDKTDDMFRAELLLGYMAGLPPEPRDDATGEPTDDPTQPDKENSDAERLF